MLGHAFDGPVCAKVMFRADPDNKRSQRAIEQLGATKDGLVRRE